MAHKPTIDKAQAERMRAEMIDLGIVPRSDAEWREHVAELTAKLNAAEARAERAEAVIEAFNDAMNEQPDAGDAVFSLLSGSEWHEFWALAEPVTDEILARRNGPDAGQAGGES